MILDPSGEYKDMGYKILKMAFGLMFIYYGAEKLLGGVESWTRVGGTMSSLGINFFPPFFGFLASLIQCLGGACLITGNFFRQACLLLFSIMCVVTLMHFSQGAGLKGASHAIEAGIVFFSMMLIGPDIKTK